MRLADRIEAAEARTVALQNAPLAAADAPAKPESPPSETVDSILRSSREADAKVKSLIAAQSPDESFRAEFEHHYLPEPEAESD